MSSHLGQIHVQDAYNHRNHLFIVVAKLLHSDHNNNFVWKSKHHRDGSRSPTGFFVLGVNIGQKTQISYHLPIIPHWKECSFAKTVKESLYNGHTGDDVINILKNLPS